MTRLAALATAAEQALADEAGRGPEAGAVGVARASFEHRLARVPEDTEAAARLAEFLPDDAVKLDTLAEAARDPNQRLPGTADPLLRTILQPGPAAARYAALEQLGDLRLGAWIGLRLRVYAEAGDAEGLVRLRETLQTAWHRRADPEDLPVAARQGLAYRVVGRIAPWLQALDEGLARVARAGFRRPAAERALAAAIGDPVRVAKLLEDERQRLEALLRAGGRERYQQALPAACPLCEILALLQQVSPRDGRAAQCEARLESLLDEAPGSAAEAAGWLAVALAGARAEGGRFAAAEALLPGRLLTHAQRRAARIAIDGARLRRSNAPLAFLAELAADTGTDLRDDLLFALLPRLVGREAVDEVWATAEGIATPGARVEARVAILEALVAAGDVEAAIDRWRALQSGGLAEAWPWMRDMHTVLDWRLTGAPADEPPGLQEEWQTVAYGAGRSDRLPRRPGARSLARLGRGELAAALRDAVQSPGGVVGFPDAPLVAWAKVARRVASVRWGELVELAWRAALANPRQERVAGPLLELPAQRLGDRVEELATTRAIRYRAAVSEAVEQAIARVGQGTASRPRTRRQ